MGGPAPNDLGTPVLAEPGSMIVFHGNTWHGSLPKTDPGPRVAVSFGFCRNYVNPAETYDDAPEVIDRVIERFGREAAALLGRESWQRYGKQGPKFEHMAKVLPANWNQHA
jgi:ectoine hydroxylase-related dioxygenase (phytanoyl-CoA dioxygenase family)